MKWVKDGPRMECRISDHMWAEIIQVTFAMPGCKWQASIFSNGFDHIAAVDGLHETESAAKSAVAAWIGKTMAQLSNALAAGETYPDDGA